MHCPKQWQTTVRNRLLAGWGRGVAIAAAGLAVALLARRLLLVLVEALAAPTAFDDAYVFYRYAAHLLGGDGLAWNTGGPQTFGCTSLLYVFWIAALKCAAIGTGPSALLAWGSWVPAVAAIGLMAWTCWRLAGSRLCRHPVVAAGFVAVCLLPQNGFFFEVGGFFHHAANFYFHTASGMDTTTALLANTLLVALVLGCKERRWSKKYVVLTAAAAYLAYLARPDNLLYAGVFPLLVIVWSGRSAPGGWRSGLLFAATLAGLLVVDGAVKYLVFGNPLPLTFYAKTGGFYEGYAGTSVWNPVRYVKAFLIAQVVPLGVLVATLGRRSLRVTLSWMIPCGLTFGYLTTVSQIMGLEARFYYPALPFFVVGAYAALDAAVTRSADSGPTTSFRAVAVRMGVAVALAVLIAPVGERAAVAWRAWAEARNPAVPVQDYYVPRRRPRLLGWWDTIQAVAGMVQRCPPEAVWAMSEHGYVGATSLQTTVIDLAGLHERSTLTGGMPVDELFDRKPDAIWVPHADYTGLIGALLESRRFHEEYDYWPGAFEFGMAIRRQSAFYDSIRREFEGSWQKLYGTACPQPATLLDVAK